MHGKKLSIQDDFNLSDEKIGDYYTAAVSVQEFRFALSEQIRRQVFYAIFVKNIETSIKSTSIMNALKQIIQQQGYHYKSCKVV